MKGISGNVALLKRTISQLYQSSSLLFQTSTYLCFDANNIEITDDEWRTIKQRIAVSRYSIWRLLKKYFYLSSEANYLW